MVSRTVGRSRSVRGRRGERPTARTAGQGQAGTWRPRAPASPAGLALLAWRHGADLPGDAERPARCLWMKTLVHRHRAIAFPSGMGRDRSVSRSPQRTSAGLSLRGTHVRSAHGDRHLAHLDRPSGSRASRHHRRRAPRLAGAHCWRPHLRLALDRNRSGYAGPRQLTRRASAACRGERAGRCRSWRRGPRGQSQPREGEARQCRRAGVPRTSPSGWGLRISSRRRRAAPRRNASRSPSTG